SVRVTDRGVSNCSRACASHAARTACCQRLVCPASAQSCCQALRRSFAHCGNCRLVYQSRSSTKVQNSTHNAASSHMTIPPALIKSSKAWLLSISQNHVLCQLLTALFS